LGPVVSEKKFSEYPVIDGQWSVPFAAKAGQSRGY
jgi:hypothetical protein